MIKRYDSSNLLSQHISVLFGLTTLGILEHNQEEGQWGDAKIKKYSRL